MPNVSVFWMSGLVVLCAWEKVCYGRKHEVHGFVPKGCISQGITHLGRLGTYSRYPWVWLGVLCGGVAAHNAEGASLVIFGCNCRWEVEGLEEVCLCDNKHKDPLEGLIAYNYQ